MKYFTAQCDAATGVCSAVTETHGPLSAPEGKVFVPLEEYDLSYLGRTWTGSVWVSPASPKEWDAFAFKMLFTRAERVAIRAAASSNGDVRDFLDLLDTAAATNRKISAESPVVVDALEDLEEAGLIASGRKAEILAGG